MERYPFLHVARLAQIVALSLLVFLSFPGGPGHGESHTPLTREEKDNLYELQGLSDRVGRWMVRNRYCPTNRRMVNLVVVEGEHSFVAGPTHPTTDIQISRGLLESFSFKRWWFGTVRTITHEWAHVCDVNLTDPAHINFNQDYGEGLADAVGYDIATRICRLERRGCFIAGSVSDTDGYAPQAKIIRVLTAKDGHWKDPAAVRMRRAMLRGWIPRHTLGFG